jgi:hypothetical protein
MMLRNVVVAAMAGYPGSIPILTFPTTLSLASTAQLVVMMTNRNWKANQVCCIYRPDRIVHKLRVDGRAPDKTQDTHPSWISLSPVSSL